MRLFDAHNHLQDARFGGQQDELIADCAAVSLSRMVVNGTCESDWPAVAALAISENPFMTSGTPFLTSARYGFKLSVISLYDFVIEFP